MATDLHAPVIAETTELGSRRIKVLSACFHVGGLAAGLDTLSSAVDGFYSHARMLSGPSPWPTLVSGALLTFGLFRTGYLLDRRRRAGAKIAAVCFVAPLISALTGGVHYVQIGLTAAGLCIIASVWKYLESE